MDFIYSHEHAVVRSPGMWEQYPRTVDRALVEARIIRELRQARERGVTAMVDVTTIDLGRETLLVQSAAETAGVRIVHATGVWLDIPRFMWPRGDDPTEGVGDVARLFIEDIQDGIGGTAIRAGAIKLASDSSVLDEKGGLTPRFERAFRAGARAAKATETPITTHTDATRACGFSQIAVFEDEGVEPGRVAIGHSTRGDLRYLLDVMERGYYLSMDTFGYLEGAEIDAGVETVAELCRRGWAGRVMLGHDHCAYIDWSWSQPAGDVTRWARIPDEIAPALEGAGIPEGQIAAVCGGTAREFFRL